MTAWPDAFSLDQLRLRWIYHKRVHIFSLPFHVLHEQLNRNEKTFKIITEIKLNEIISVRWFCESNAKEKPPFNKQTCKTNQRCVRIASQNGRTGNNFFLAIANAEITYNKKTSFFFFITKNRILFTGFLPPFFTNNLPLKNWQSFRVSS